MTTTVRYTTINGEIIAEKRNGVRSLYVPDPLGSTRALINSSQTQTDTFSYWPYGEVQSRTGSTPTPFLFVGILGYYKDSATRTYVRARYYRQDLGRWATMDPAKYSSPGESLYAYVSGEVASSSDPSGLFQYYGNYCGPNWPPPGQRPKPINELDACCQAHDDCYANAGVTAGVWLACQAIRRRGGIPRNLVCLWPKCRAIVQCDHQLCQCALGANCHWNLGCNAARLGILAWMCTS